MVIIHFRRRYLEKTGQAKTSYYKVAVMAEEMGGCYSFTKMKGIPVEAIKVSFIKLLR